MKLKPTPLPGQKCHHHQQPSGPALMLALPPARRAQGLHTPHPHSCGNTTLPTSLSLFCLQSPEHDQALPWGLDSRIASHSFASQASPAELQDPRSHCQPSLLSRARRAPLQCLSPAPRLTLDLPPAWGVTTGQAIKLQQNDYLGARVFPGQPCPPIPPLPHVSLAAN